MKALEVEHPENAKDVMLTDPIFGSQNPDLSESPKEHENVGTANPSFGAGNGGLGKPNGVEKVGLVIAPAHGGQHEEVEKVDLVIAPANEGQHEDVEKVDLVIAPANGGQPGQNQVQESTPNQVQEPASRKVVPVGSGNDPIEGETGLVDSGATHALREGTQEEMRAAKHVPVTAGHHSHASSHTTPCANGCFS